jgi:hypothetical protein
MAYEKFKTIVTFEEFFNSWKLEELARLDSSMRQFIYQKHVLKCVVFQRDEFKCQNKDCKCPESPLTIHHIKFQKNGGENKVKNCITICKSCHKNFHRGKIALVFWGATYRIHSDNEIDWKQIKLQSKEIRNAVKHLHGVNISMEMAYYLLKWLEEHNEYEGDDD